MNSGLISFFKVITNSQKMDLPLATLPQMQGVLGRRVALRNVDNKTWSVGVERGGDGYFFTEGWPQFYQENSLEPDYIVIFTYKHKDLFDVKVFGHNACEKIGVGGTDIRVEEEAEEFTVVEKDEGEEEEEEEEDEDEDNEEEDEDDSDDEDYVIEMLEPEEAPIQLVKEEVIQLEDDEDEEESSQRDGHDETNNKSKAKHKHKHSRASSSSVHKKRTLKDYYGHDIFLSGLATQPKNPYFVSRSRHSRNNELNIPGEVISCLNLKFPSKFFLVDKNGMKWEAEIKKWKDGRLWCTSGWKMMCRANNIKEDDTCICEFVQEGRFGLSMLVRVVDAAARK